MTLAELLRQKADLDRKIVELRSEGRSMAVAEILELMGRHGLTVADVSAEADKPSRKALPRAASKPVAAKYKDDQGHSWTGRGLKPKWLVAALASGKQIEEFAVSR